MLSKEEFEEKQMLMNEIQNFLNNYELLKTKTYDLNFFQIAGFPYYEEVSSNVLKYFLRNNYIVKALFNCIPLDFDISNDNFKFIEREFVTEKNKRIDIIIFTNKYIVGIENKINADLDNPIDEYVLKLEELSEKQNKKPLLIILSKNIVKSDNRYINILYRKFSAEVKKYYPQLLSDLGVRYFLLLSEYIANVDSFEEYYLNDEFVKKVKSDIKIVMKIIDENFQLYDYTNTIRLQNNLSETEFAKVESNLKEKIEQIKTESHKLRDYIRNYANNLLSDLNLLNAEDVFQNAGDINRPPEDIFYSAVYFEGYCLGENNRKLVLEANIDIRGVDIEIFNRKEGCFDHDFEKMLTEIFTNFEDKFKFDYDDYNPEKGTFVFFERIELEKYDKVLSLLNNIIRAFEKYKNVIND
jgi:hypothetical protein